MKKFVVRAASSEIALRPLYGPELIGFSKDGVKEIKCDITLYEAKIVAWLVYENGNAYPIVPGEPTFPLGILNPDKTITVFENERDTIVLDSKEDFLDYIEEKEKESKPTNIYDLLKESEQ